MQYNSIHKLHTHLRIEPTPQRTKIIPYVKKTSTESQLPQSFKGATHTHTHTHTHTLNHTFPSPLPSPPTSYTNPVFLNPVTSTRTRQKNFPILNAPPIRQQRDDN